MRYIFLIALALLFSCKKSSPDATKKVCYRFEFQIMNVPGCERPSTYLDTCIDPWVEVTKLKFTDKCNNDLGWIARPR